MNHREFFGSISQRPGMYGLDGSFAPFCLFLEGYNAGTSWYVFAGFREWLVMQLGEVSAGNNLAWPFLVLELAFPEGWSSRTRERSGLSPLPSLNDQANTGAVEALFHFLDAFLELREQSEGLTTIFRDYAAWLERYHARIQAKHSPL